MNLSYWDIQSWLTHIDYTVVESVDMVINCSSQIF
jgi:hypothetical protein